MFKIGDRVIITDLHYNKSTNISSRIMSCYNNIHPVYLNDIGTIIRVENPLTCWGEQKTEYILCIVFDKYKISIPDYFHGMFQWRFSLAETPKGNKLIIKQ